MDETTRDGPPLLLLAGLGPAGSHVIFHSGSFSHVEEPEAVFGLIRDFTAQ